MIKIFCIAQSRVNDSNYREWLRHLGVSEETISSFDVLNDSEKIIGGAAKRCYNSFEVGLNPNVTRIRQDWVDYFDNILASGHGSVLEHVTYTYAIEGLSRVATAELNRHRAGVAISEASMRYIRLSDGILFSLPDSIVLSSDEQAAVDDFLHGGVEPSEKIMDKYYATLIFKDVLASSWKSYEALEEQLLKDDMPFDKKKKITSLIRRILPMGVATGGVWTFNLRALRHIIALRCTPHAEEEICLLMGMIARDIFADEGKLMGDFVEKDGFWTPRYNKV